MWFVLFISVPIAGLYVREPIDATRLPPWVIAPAFLLFVVAMLAWLPWFTTPYPAERKRMLMMLRNSLKGALTRPLRRVDPFLGPLLGEWVEYRRERYVCWRAVNPFPEFGDEVGISIFTADASGPTDWQRELLCELRRQVPTIERIIEGPLAAQYETIRRDWELDASPPIIEPSDIWKVARLCRIEINQQDRSNSDLVLNYAIEWEDEDHDLNVALRDWQVAAVTLEG
jgi:hypothetical protein